MKHLIGYVLLVLAVIGIAVFQELRIRQSERLLIDVHGSMISFDLKTKTEAYIQLWKIIDSDDPEDRANAKRLVIAFIQGYHPMRELLTSPPYSIDRDDTDLVAEVDAALLAREELERDRDGEPEASAEGPSMEEVAEVRRESKKQGKGMTGN